MAIAVIPTMAGFVAENSDATEVDGINYSVDAYAAHVVAKTPVYTGTIYIPGTVTVSGTTYPVVSIEDGAFKDCSALTSVTIPPSVVSIGNEAFLRCAHLTSLDIPDSVASIGNKAFAASGILSIVVPAPVISIGTEVFSGSDLISASILSPLSTIPEKTFWGCDDLVSFTIPSSVTSIGNYAFYGCEGLSSVNIPSSVISIGSYAFANCYSLSSVVIPNSVITIDGTAFFYSGLTSVSIPSSVTSIGNLAFARCGDLQSISVDPGNSNYSSSNGVMFNKSGSLLITYPAGKTGAYTIPASVTTIRTSAFSYAGITSVTIPSSVTTIGTDAFSFTGITLATIPESTVIADIFSGTPSNLIKVFYSGTERLDAVRSGSAVNLTAHVPSGKNVTAMEAGSSSGGSDVALTGSGSSRSFASGSLSSVYVRVTIMDVLPTVSYTISVSSNTGGTATGGGTYADGASASISAIPYEGYKFVKWSDGNTQAYRTVKVISNAAYGAVFEKIVGPQFTITYDPNGGNFEGGAPTQTATAGSEIDVQFSSLPTKEDYIFIGWSESSDSAAKYTETGYVKLTVTGDVTLYADWEVPSEPMDPITDDGKSFSLWWILLILIIIIILILIWRYTREKTDE
ncbi:MAG: leucine-rich repeat protein [Candidatus Methanoplasma sp.]|jgi:uncharacterized repeat protein (TIGR02543 family)|nr:leucine-rich repeat protein [Candidatus Methanoplasma sp.]